MRKTLAALLALTALAGPALAAPENWQTFQTKGDVEAAIDTDSVKADGALRHFRTRMGKAGDPRVAYAEMEADCAAGTLEPLRFEMFVSGKQVGTKDPLPDHKMRATAKDDEEAATVIGIVCKA